MEYIVIMAIGALASVLANRGIAVFNDGFRPIMPQYYEGKLSRAELAATSFAISFGLVIGFGIPTSIAASIILIHCILLTTDIIGTWMPDNLAGTIASAVIGGLYGLGILVGLQFVVDLFAMLPYNFLSDLGKVSSFIVVAFAIFPAVAVGYQQGFTKGAITGSVTFICYLLIAKFGSFTLGDFKIALNPAGMSMLVGMIMMLVFAAQQKGEGSANANLASVFSEKVERIRKNWILLTVMGSLLAVGASLSIVAGDPTSLNLLAEGDSTAAALAAFARAIGFVPLVFTTAIVTGVYGPAGCTFVFVVGLAFTGNPVVAAILGAVVIILELLLINVFAKGMDKFPGVKDMGEHIRTAMNKVLEVSLLVGGIVAAEAMAIAASGMSGIGALFVIGVLLLNRVSKKPIVELAIGPVAAILFGIILNILLVVSLISIPVV
ncbi:MAG: YhfT family protein [Erysipelotrichaceae bacterium]